MESRWDSGSRHQSVGSVRPMKLETFFAKFDQVADAPDAVAKMRELVLRLSANGAPLRSASSQRQRRAPSQPGATPQDHRPHSFPALKGRPNA